MPYTDQIRIDRTLLLEFFLCFSRFEYALKAAGFATGGHDHILPNWRRFARSLRDKFDKNSDTEVSKACDYILDDPPRKQVFVNGKLAWNTQARSRGDSGVEFLLRMVRTVRNNLFHGGKHNIEVHEDTARSEALLRSSLAILNECLRLSRDLKRTFEGAML